MSSSWPVSLTPYSRKAEKHMILYTKDGFKTAQYAGPGTHLLKRLKRGDPGLTETDITSKAHDIRYTLAQSPSAVREADQKMVATLNRIQKNKEDYLVNILTAKGAIKLKMALEDLGMSRTAFTSYGTKLSTSDRELLIKNESKLTQKGYGL